MKSRNIQKINFVEYNARLNTLATTRMFPKYGTPLLASIMREKGYDARILLEGVSDMRLEKILDCDMVCLPVYSPAVNKIRACAKAIREARPDLPIVMGGPHASLYPDFVVGSCDVLVRCEGDEILPRIAECYAAGTDPRALPGISYKDGDRVVHNPEGPPPAIPATIPDYTLIDGFDKFYRGTNRRRVVNLLQTSRGCRYKCNFCPTNRLFGGTYRNRDIDSIIADIKARKAYSPVFLVVDNSFLSDRQKTIVLLNRLIEEDLGAWFIVFERNEIGRDAELLALMFRAGVRCIIVGIESLDDGNLEFYNKKQTSAGVKRNVRNILDGGIHVIGTFVLGGDADTPAKGREIVKYVTDTGISLNLFIMHDIETDESKGLMIPLDRRFETYYRRQDPENLDFADYMIGNFVTYFPKRMKPSTLQRMIIDVHRGVFNHRNIVRRVFSRNVFAAVFHIAHGYSLMRLTDNIESVINDYYLGYLEEIERGLYDENEVLIEERLATIERLPIPRRLADGADYATYNGFIIALLIPGLVRAGILLLRKKLFGTAPIPQRTAPETA